MDGTDVFSVDPVVSYASSTPDDVRLVLHLSPSPLPVRPRPLRPASVADSNRFPGAGRNADVT